jgi:hypothetical protein
MDKIINLQAQELTKKVNCINIIPQVMWLTI